LHGHPKATAFDRPATSLECTDKVAEFQLKKLGSPHWKFVAVETPIVKDICHTVAAPEFEIW
jgi:hypothetical protein